MAFLGLGIRICFADLAEVSVGMTRSLRPAVAHLALWWLPFRVGAATHLANLNWLTADLVNHAFIANMSALHGEDNDLSISSEEFDSSEAALQGLQDGTVDIMLECWNDTIAV